MKQVPLGRSGLTVTRWCLGTNVIGGTLDEPAAQAVLDAYHEAGGNFIDTANIYGDGRSEAVIGRWMKARGNRESIVLATKIGFAATPSIGEQGLSRKSIVEGVESSLRRLDTDWIDLYYAHCDDPEVPLDETLSAFQDLIEAGKVRAVAASNYSRPRLEQALDLATGGRARYECLQIKYNLVDRSDYEPEMAALCTARDLPVTTFFSLARGFLTGKYSRSGPPPETPRAKAVAANYLNETGFAVLGRVEAVALEAGATPAQVSLAWLLRRPNVAAFISAATSAEQVAELARYPEVSLSDDQVAFLAAGSEA